VLEGGLRQRPRGAVGGDAVDPGACREDLADPAGPPTDPPQDKTTSPFRLEP
jgi:hypothetical protein